MLAAKRLSLWRRALSSLRRNIPVLLLYVVESKGSSPGRQGFFMLVNGAGEMEGSIGGGIMEFKFTELAREYLSEGVRVSQLRRQVHDKAEGKDRSGMICSGEQTILLYSLRADDLPAVIRLVDSLEDYRNGCLRLSPEGMSFRDEPPAVDFHFEVRGEGDWSYEEKTGYIDRLFIIGGGHCALAFSRVMQTMDFYIVLFDDRKGLDSIRRNEYVNEQVLVSDYDDLRDLVEGEGRYHYVMVMTQGYRTDDRAVRALLDKDFRYFGLLGSKAKIGKMFETYRAEGMDEKRLGRLRAPAGLAIHSQTPEEIAVSIAAEIIQVKHAAIIPG
ncbi:MAG: XdhC family protein [Bacteroidetes bacterium]|nr:XdhC family protein [Bacteroidota bacterium]